MKIGGRPPKSLHGRAKAGTANPTLATRPALALGKTISAGASALETSSANGNAAVAPVIPPLVLERIEAALAWAWLRPLVVGAQGLPLLQRIGLIRIAGGYLLIEVG